MKISEREKIENLFWELLDDYRSISRRPETGDIEKYYDGKLGDILDEIDRRETNDFYILEEKYLREKYSIVD